MKGNSRGLKAKIIFLLSIFTILYNATTGAITGSTASPYDDATAQASHTYKHPYIVTQVRKSKAL